MVNLSYWIAAGYFFEMVERQREEKLCSKDVEQPLSEFDTLMSIPSTLQVRSCPVRSVDADLRKTLSCPMAAFTCPALAAISPTTTSEVQFCEATVRMMQFLDSIRSKRTNLDTLDETASLRTEFTLFDMMDGFFSPKSSSSQPSLFEKLDGLFAETAEPTLPRNTPVTKPEDTISSGLSVWSTRPQTFYCPSCKSWNSLDTPSVPQLPVFVKSPVDSLKIYKASPASDDDEIVFEGPSPSSIPTDDTLQNVLSITNLPTQSEHSPVEPVQNQPSELRELIEKQKEMIEMQQKVILALNTLYSTAKKPSVSDV